MLFLQVFIRISIQFGGFSEQHQGQEKFPAKFSMFLRAKPQILRVLKLQYDVNKIFACASVANKFVLLEDRKQSFLKKMFTVLHGFFSKML